MKRNIIYIFKIEKKLSELKIIYKFCLLMILFIRDFIEIIEKKIMWYFFDIIKVVFIIEKILDFCIDVLC